MDLWLLVHTLADPDYYEPLRRYQDHSSAFRPAGVPEDWRESHLETWTAWAPTNVTLPEQGWKIHVSAMLDRAGHVLDQVAGVCVGEGVPFKHLATEFHFIYAHHKHGPRAQAGKFCTLYPPDQRRARRLLDLLADRLRAEEGPYILTDRRYRDSRTVHYRYGAFQPLTRVRPDGSTVRLVRDGSGALVEDLRGVTFAPPAGVTDPFAGPSAPTVPAAPTVPSKDAEGVRLGAYRVVGALAHSNAGGAYRALDPSGRTLFIKEARAHNGLHWDRTTARQRLRREHQVLRDLHARAPGLAPAPIDYFRRWEHEFLVTLRRGAALLHAELGRGTLMPGGELGFREDGVRRRVMAYLAVGAAGVGHVLTRYVHAAADERLAEAVPRVFGYADKQLTVEPGLYFGLAGLGLAQADHANLGGAGDPSGPDRAVRVAAGLVKWAIPGPGSRVRFLGTVGMRFSTELWSGAAGILLALDRILNGPNGPNGQFFTLEDLLDADGNRLAGQ